MAISLKSLADNLNFKAGGIVASNNLGSIRDAITALSGGVIVVRDMQSMDNWIRAYRTNIPYIDQGGG